MINESNIFTGIAFAFKRCTEINDIRTELTILSLPMIRAHPGIVTLEGLCWDGKAQNQTSPRAVQVLPVLVYKKAESDLKRFIDMGLGRKMTIDERVRACATIGNAIATLHTHGLSHLSNLAPDVRSSLPDYPLV